MLSNKSTSQLVVLFHVFAWFHCQIPVWAHSQSQQKRSMGGAPDALYFTFSPLELFGWTWTLWVRRSTTHWRNGPIVTEQRRKCFHQTHCPIPLPRLQLLNIFQSTCFNTLQLSIKENQIKNHSRKMDMCHPLYKDGRSQRHISHWFECLFGSLEMVFMVRGNW